MQPSHVVTQRNEAPPGAAAPSVRAQPSSPGDLIRICANCGGSLDERKCKLICRGCGYFLSCSDYY